MGDKHKQPEPSSPEEAVRIVREYAARYGCVGAPTQEEAEAAQSYLIKGLRERDQLQGRLSEYDGMMTRRDVVVLDKHWGAQLQKDALGTEGYRAMGWLEALGTVAGWDAHRSRMPREIAHKLALAEKAERQTKESKANGHGRAG